MTRILIGLGANMGDRAANLAQAVRLLEEQVQDLRLSSIYESAPIGLVNQAFFLNQAAFGKTELLPSRLLAFFKDIEHRMGRETTIVNGPRPIDLDLLFYDDWIIHGDGLIVPHPRWSERAFVLAPLSEVAADFPDPATGESIGSVWARKAGDLAAVWLYTGDTNGRQGQ